MEQDFADKILILDLGDVIFDVSFQRMFDYWSAITKIDASEIESKFKFDGIVADYSVGAVSTSEFWQLLQSEMQLALTYDEFLTGWNSIFGPSRADIIATLRKISAQMTIVAFTNTNEAHHMFCKKRYYEELACFSKVFCSQEIHFRKPDPDSYLFLNEELGKVPSNLFFLDDSLENVEEALASGWNAKQFSLAEGKETLADAIANLLVL